MIYLTYNQDGRPTGLYRQALHPDHEAAYLELTDAQAQDWLALWVDPETGALTARPPSPPSAPTVPQQVTRFQGMAALSLAGLLDDVEAYMAAPERTAMQQLAWKEVLHFERQSNLVNQLGTDLGLSAAQIDQLFITAGGITV